MEFGACSHSNLSTCNIPLPTPTNHLCPPKQQYLPQHQLNNHPVIQEVGHTYRGFYHLASADQYMEVQLDLCGERQKLQTMELHTLGTQFF